MVLLIIFMSILILVYERIRMIVCVDIFDYKTTSRLRNWKK